MTSPNNKLITDKEFNDIDIWETEEGRIKGYSTCLDNISILIIKILTYQKH